MAYRLHSHLHLRTKFVLTCRQCSDDFCVTSGATRIITCGISGCGVRLRHPACQDLRLRSLAVPKMAPLAEVPGTTSAKATTSTWWLFTGAGECICRIPVILSWLSRPKHHLVCRDAKMRSKASSCNIHHNMCNHNIRGAYLVVRRSMPLA
jgi:hypothetical protein